MLRLAMLQLVMPMLQLVMLLIYAATGFILSNGHQRRYG